MALSFYLNAGGIEQAGMFGYEMLTVRTFPTRNIAETLGHVTPWRRWRAYGRFGAGRFDRTVVAPNDGIIPMPVKEYPLPLLPAPMRVMEY